MLAALALSRYALGRIDLRAGLNGAIAGLVSIAAGPELVDHLWACLIGAVGGAVCTFGMRLLERLRIDDEVGAIPAHLGGGVWGSLAVCLAAGGDPGVQAVGIVTVAVFVFSTSLGVWWLIDKTMGARIRRMRKGWDRTPRSLASSRSPSSSWRRSRSCRRTPGPPPLRLRKGAGSSPRGRRRRRVARYVLQELPELPTRG